jgi:4-amino-4-deoxy-L-arabinose transferase-like glycosyltransferase
MAAAPEPLDRRDGLIALGLALGYVVLLLLSAGSLGYARDEGFYFQSARSYGQWFELLFSEPGAALERANIDRFWAVNREHPALMKSLFALSHGLFYDKLRWFSEQGTAYRFPGMLMAGLALATIYAWGRQLLGRVPGLVAALLFAAMPHMFYHAHLACFDIPVAAMWLVTAYAYFRSLHTTKLGWAIGCGVLYGLLLDTKHNAWLLPPALVLHLLVTRGSELWAELRRGRVTLPKGLLAMALLGPLVFYAGWPWIWHDTIPRLTEYVKFHTGHEYYNMEFLGRTYWKPPMPLLYAWVMTLATVPTITLVLFACGLVSSAFAVRGRTQSEGGRLRFSTDVLWALGLLTSYAPWLSDTTPIFGGTKHWITAYPFLCLFAARGFAVAAQRCAALFPRLRTELTTTGLALAVLAAPLVMTAHSHPWGLSFYTPLVGGVPGAANLGLNRTFWGYTTDALLGFINQRAARNAGVYVHDTALQSFDMLELDGRARRDLRPTLAIHQSQLALYHHEAHMRRVEYQIWIDYGTAAPAALGVYDGVPIVWVYERRRRSVAGR